MGYDRTRARHCSCRAPAGLRWFAAWQRAKGSRELCCSCFLVFLANVPEECHLEEAMKNLAKKVQRFLVSEDGPTAVEYAVMLALIVIVCLAAIQAIGTNASQAFQNVATQIGSTSS